ncbi:conserved hypothetical protein [Desulfamplus magnetovallimortis]|uniref:Uncharacterized protein n=1 Tax=Desulfamplus magnetovallimortis TaxID=1246637 RepID=A0A1W1HA05_9BACT|nr:hypothetical protein [Desulfamplus magnetovallimortis]SLM29320.1 conserved hypothetical protein [Desulfamplus magnetovallimortis]
MTTVQPQGENLRKAIAWISEQRKENADQSSVVLAENAAVRFDLAPDDSEFLLRFVSNMEE